MKTNISKWLLVTVLVHLANHALALEKPNILVIWGDDIGPYNISAYNMGRMGYKTPNIDRIAHEGIIFTDSYGIRVAQLEGLALLQANTLCEPVSLR